VIAHDPGGKVRIRNAADVVGEAWFSPCHRYRYALARTWTSRPARVLLWIGMNPSVADAEVDDPTVQREVKRTRGLGYDAYIKGNVLDYRATNPKDLVKTGVIANSAENHRTLLLLAERCEAVVMAHGILPASLRHHAQDLTRKLAERGHTLLCLGQNADGSPKHPLYIAGSAPLRAYRPTA
jgi:hypothetical protein